MGKTMELINYEKPYFYNFPPTPRKHFHFEEKEIKKERRIDNLILARKKLKQLITANAYRYKYNDYNIIPLFITYTFASHFDDPVTANPEFTKYSKRLNTFLFNRGLDKAKYICVIEFTKIGRVHYHVLYFNIPFIENIKLELAKIWGLGFIKVVSVKRIKSLASYLSKYLQKGIQDPKLKAKKAYFSSRGLFKPLVYRNEKDILSMLQDIEKENIIKVIHNEKYISSKYGLVEFNQLEKDN